MTWHRGFVVCPDHTTDQAFKFLVKESNACRLASVSGETAFAFTSRAIPDPETYAALVIGVDHGSSNYLMEVHGGFSHLHLAPRLWLTCALVITSDFVAMQTKELRRLMKQIGDPSDQSKEGGLQGFRWDLQFNFYDPKIRSLTRSFNEA